MATVQQEFDASGAPPPQGGNRGAAPATVQHEFDASGALLKLYEGLPYVKKLGYSIGEMDGHILLRVIIEGDKNADEFHDYSMVSVRKAREFEDMLPARMREEYMVAPIVTSPYGGALRHFGTMTAVIDR